MPLDNVVFWVFAPISVASAIGMLLVRNAVHAALFLIVNFFCLAVFFLLLDAPFLFVVQIVVYASAIVNPTSGTYMYRSAMAWPPTCTRPITGTSVPIHHSQPTRIHGRSFLVTIATVDPASRSATPAAIFHAGGPPVG